jgi:hypothetical protein
MTESIRPDSLRQLDAQDEKAAAEARRRAELDRRAAAAEHVEDDVDRDETPADGDDVSPHYGRRAQPGDVLGLETGGETTGIGDTAEDEDERRRAAVKKASGD